MDLTVIITGLVVILASLVLAAYGYVKGYKLFIRLGIVLIFVGFVLMASPVMSLL